MRPCQVLLFGEILGRGLPSWGIGVWQPGRSQTLVSALSANPRALPPILPLPSTSSQACAAQDSIPGKASQFPPRAPPHVLRPPCLNQPYLESQLPPSLWMETPSQLPGDGQVCFGATWGARSGNDELFLT